MGVGALALVAARTAMAAMFLQSALDKFRAPPEEVHMIAALHLPAPAALERLTGVFEVLTGAGLAMGIYGRLDAALLAAFVLFVSFAFLRFWSFEGPPEARVGIRNIFFANIGVSGGLVALAVHGLGRLVIVDL